MNPARAIMLASHVVVSPVVAQSAPWRQTQADDYTRYELLDPAAHSFRI